MCKAIQHNFIPDISWNASKCDAVLPCVPCWLAVMWVITCNNCVYTCNLMCIFCVRRSWIVNSVRNSVRKWSVEVLCPFNLPLCPSTTVNPRICKASLYCEHKLWKTSLFLLLYYYIFEMLWSLLASTLQTQNSYRPPGLIQTHTPCWTPLSFFRFGICACLQTTKI